MYERVIHAIIIIPHFHSRLDFQPILVIIDMPYTLSHCITLSFESNCLSLSVFMVGMEDCHCPRVCAQPSCPWSMILNVNWIVPPNIMHTEKGLHSLSLLFLPSIHPSILHPLSPSLSPHDSILFCMCSMNFHPSINNAYKAYQTLPSFFSLPWTWAGNRIQKV